MNKTTWERLVWKEHRMLRGLWVAAVVLCGLVLFAMAWQMKSTGDPTLFFQVAMGIGACYALGCGAEAFAGEREARTDLFQSALPASGRQLLIAKSSHAALSALALLVVLWCLAWLAVGIWLKDFSGTVISRAGTGRAGSGDHRAIAGLGHSCSRCGPRHRCGSSSGHLPSMR